ncbi:MAG: hypothetical protein ACYTGN_17245 [Planctomycetota bacterium]|jgi:hypothetical protein
MRSAIAGPNTTSPSATRRMAFTISSGSSLLDRKPHAPAATAASMYVSRT